MTGSEEAGQLTGFLVATLNPAPPVYDPGGLTCREMSSPGTGGAKLRLRAYGDASWLSARKAPARTGIRGFRGCFADGRSGRKLARTRGTRCANA